MRKGSLRAALRGVKRFRSCKFGPIIRVAEIRLGNLIFHLVIPAVPFSPSPIADVGPQGPVISASLTTVFQFRLVAGPAAFGIARVRGSDNRERPRPFGVWR